MVSQVKLGKKLKKCLNSVKFQKVNIVEYSSKVDALEMTNIVDDCACDLKMRTNDKVRPGKVSLR